MDNNDYKAINQRINSEAKEIFETYGLDEIRVAKVLHKLAEINWYDPSSAVYIELEKAFQHLSPDDALELFEKEDLTRLATRVLLVEYLNARTTPFYILDKLADLTKEFIDHLHENKDHLLKTGFPESTFNKSLWLDKHLNKLYYVKMPVKVHELFIPSRGRRKGILKNVYSWNEKAVDHNMKTSLQIAHTIEELKQYRGKKDIDSRRSYDMYSMDLKAMLQEIELNLNAYKDAPLIQGLTEEDAVKIESIRGKLFDLKVIVLEKLYHAVKNKSKYKLIADCVKIINKYLTAEEVNFLIKKDHFYSNVVYEERASCPGNGSSLISHNAGLSDLFMVIGHFHKEIELSTIDETYKSLKILPYKKLPESYYKAVGKRWEEDLNHILFYFSRLEDREEPFWVKYTNQINRNLHMELLASNVVSHNSHLDTQSLINIDQESFRKFLQHMISTGQIIISDKGKVIINTPSSDILEHPGSEYVFKLMGEKWDVVYKRESTHLDDSIGVRHIHRLLEQPNWQFPVLTLYLLTTGTIVSNIKELERRIYDEDSIYVQSMGNQTILDEQAVEEYEERLEQINNELEVANKCSDQVEIDKLREEKTFIQSEKNKSKGLGNRKRRFSDESERARKTVSKAINSVIDRLNKKIYLPPLSNHFKLTIKTGYKVSYMPEEKIPWKL